MPPPQRVREWIAQNYQKPAIDQEWLTDCSHWVQTELSFDPNTQFDDFIQHVEAQLLQSNLADSTVPASGVDPLLFVPNQNPPRRDRKTTGPTPLLVEIKSITEIAHAAFSLLNTHQSRIDRADLGLAHEHDVDQHRDEDEGPVPKFPRGMLRFELSDGSTTFRAIEFGSLPQLELDTTPLGYKMLLKSTPIRNGIAFLEPQNVTLKGYKTEDHDINREEVFLSSLRRRLGRPDPPPEAPAMVQPQPNPPAQPVPAQPPQRQPPPVPRPPSPPVESDEMDGIDPDVLREMAIQIDQQIDRPNNQLLGAPPSLPSTSKETSANPRQSVQKKTNTTASFVPSNTSSTVKTSVYFPSQSHKSELSPDIGLSPRPALPPNLEIDFDNTWETDEPESYKVPITKPNSTSARPPSTVPLKLTEKRPASPDPFDDLSFDMDVDFDRLDMIEQDALATGANDKGKGKRKDTSMAPAKSALVQGTKYLAQCPIPTSSAEPSTRTQSRAKSAASGSSLSGPSGSSAPLSAQSLARGRRIPRDPSLIVIPSSEDEASGDHGKGRPLNPARRRAKKPRQMNQDEVENPDVIDITD